MPWSPDPAYAGATVLSQAVLCLNDLLAQAREQLSEREHEAFVDIALRRLTSEWRSLLDDASDDPRGVA
jgi:glucose-6-phosphate dehydrogenase assembly protein OpcA